ncbi:arylformamidase (plasmid) [Tsukamurella tyrosinosolvens]|uniref:Kynurenine formamidase n=1 Tax=Tsukamurella tyrosinosolvens TaxID=57704 RepID=A0A1H4TWL8_TSUTY|nr:cyclase family protein [Tsukamurella tyrosinosolvens]KXO93089.1 cyclase [Tsukamurella tyrosinosolvens]RDB48329.1 cyclase family protein [Tsukamurella tyrosinosolvens]SEC60451.1 Kynurenine formamidase [Tsukamurella tyrosinosolvens]VEH93861.1 arylformamidase [Tsukamurella tyrosinosolvens]
MLTELATALAGGRIRVLDLTTPLSADTPTLRLPEPFVNLIDFSLERVAAFEPTAPAWQHNNIHTGEHIGTHVDAPCHWITGRDGADVSQLPPARLVGPACVMDFADRAAADPDWLLDVADVQGWIAEHGAIPEGAWLLLRTGWDQYGGDRERFLNVDEGGSHTPGVSAACAQWLAEEVPISGFGVETVGIDAGNAAMLEPPFPAHNFLLGADKYGLTSLRNLTQLPPQGAVVVVSPLPIVGGTGSPARVLALVQA